MMEKRPKTIFLDIDGSILYHFGSLSGQVKMQAGLLPGVLEAFDEWDRKGYKIILVTGRRESMRKKTEEQLQSFSIFYDQLVMGCTGGQRILINDLKENSEQDTAVAINIKRNGGIEDLKAL